MLAPEITLAAALRDASSSDPRYRYQAAENLARALLFELQQPGPRWHAAAEHPQGPAVLEALRTLVRERGPAVLRGAAAVGLGLLGEPEVLDLTEAWLELAPDDADADADPDPDPEGEADAPPAASADDEERGYLRESAMMAAVRVHRAAAQADAAPQVQQRVETLVEAALRSTAPDLRYQGALALVELQGQRAEPALARALAHEEHLAVREGLVEAMSLLDPPGPAACEALEQVLAGPEAAEGLGFEAAMTLAAARRSSARPRLVDALPVRHQRDRALEALAALGRQPTPPSAAEIDAVHRLAGRLWLPAITRVRAAYALARMVAPGSGTHASPNPGSSPNPGLVQLGRLRWHPRAAVREAVRDAFANLEQLAARERT